MEKAVVEKDFLQSSIQLQVNLFFRFLLWNPTKSDTIRFISRVNFLAACSSTYNKYVSQFTILFLNFWNTPQKSHPWKSKIH